MSVNSNAKKAKQLGMPLGTAAGRLKKMFLFSLLKKYGLNICYQCGGEIESPENLSIEHKIPWLDSDDPIKNFFDLDNVAVSHHSCNVASARRYKLGHGTAASYRRGCRCEDCRAAYSKSRKAQYLRTGK